MPFLRENQENLIQEIKEGKYKPNPVRRVEIPKETKGEFRKLGVPTVVDRVISLIHKYLNAGVVANGKFERTEVGMSQGGPLSPLLSNIMLNELDKELESRGHRFVRYADGCMIFCKSRKSAERTLKNIIPYIERKLFLKVNRKKTEVAHISKVKYLGYTFYRSRGKCRFRVHQKSIVLFKNKIRELACSRKGYWRMAKVLKQIFSNKIIAKLGYASMLDYYLVVCEN